MHQETLALLSNGENRNVNNKRAGVPPVSPTQLSSGGNKREKSRRNLQWHGSRYACEVAVPSLGKPMSPRSMA